MSFTNGKIERTMTSADRRLMVDIVARTDGLYQFHVHRFEQQPDEARWLPVRVSGLYSTYAECEADALIALEA